MHMEHTRKWVHNSRVYTQESDRKNKMDEHTYLMNANTGRSGGN